MAWFQISFFSECLRRSVPLNVLLPAESVGPGVPVKSTEQYRTLYLLHGYMGNAQDWLLNTKIQEMSQQFNIAVVMPNGYNGFYVDQPRSGIRGSEFISQELVSFTRKLFPLSDRREDTLIGGLSMGGWGALYNAFRHSDVFGSAIGLSPPMILEDAVHSTDEPNFMGIQRGYYETVFGNVDQILESEANLSLVAKRALDTGVVLPNLYIACGYNDKLVPDNRKFVSYLKSLGIDHIYEEGPGTHEWFFWDRYLRRGLEQIIPEPPVTLSNPFWIEKEV